VIVDLIAKEEALRRRQESDVKDHQAKIARIRKQMDIGDYDRAGDSVRT